jgi:hypothetical protein
MKQLFAVLAVFLLALAPLAFAQEDNGSDTGATDTFPGGAPDPNVIGPSGTVQIGITGVNGNPIAEATVVLHRPIGDWTQKQETDTSGIVVYGGLFAGKYSYTVYANGYERGTATFTLGADDDITKSTLRLERVKENKPNKIKLINVQGTGLAINTADPFDFSHTKVIVGGIRVKKEGCNTTDDTENCIETKRLGVLAVNETRYQLRNVEVTEEGITADVFQKVIGIGEPNEVGSLEEIETTEHVGTLAVRRFEKPGQDVWAGKLSITEQEYNVYFLGIKRVFKPQEIKDKLGDFCKKNPTEQQCRHLNLCKNNPDAKQCGELKEKFCEGNTGDVRCRAELKKLCHQKPSSEFCQKLTVNGKEVVSIKKDQKKFEDVTVKKEIKQRKPNIIRKKLVDIKRRPLTPQEERDRKEAKQKILDRAAGVE